MMKDIERVQLNNAEKCLTRAYEIRKQKLGPFHSRTGQTLKRIHELNNTFLAISSTSPLKMLIEYAVHNNDIEKLISIFF